MKLSKLRAHTSTRMVAGQSVPRQNTTSFGMRHALKVAGSKYAGDSGEVEGAAARPRLDRPGRAHGGRVCKADGGWTGEGDSGKPMKERAAELRDEARVNDSSALKEAGLGAGAIAAGKYLVPKRNFGTKTGALVGGLGLLGSAAVQKLAAGGRRMAADKADKVGDEAEGHKSGGRVMDKDDDCYAKGGFLSGMKRGALHRELNVPEGEKIPAKKLERAEHSDNPKLRKRAILAQTMKSWKRG